MKSGNLCERTTKGLSAFFLLLIAACGSANEGDERALIALLSPPEGNDSADIGSLGNDEVLRRALSSRLGKNSFFGSMTANSELAPGITEIPINEMLPDILPGNSGIPELDRQTLIANGIVALKSAAILPYATVESNVFILSQCRGFFTRNACKGLKGELTFGPHSSQVEGFISKADTIALLPHADIKGKAFANDYRVFPRATITERDSPVGAIPILPKFLRGTPGKNSLYATRSRTVGPGRYGKLVVYSGRELTLAEGYYQIKSLYLHPGAIIQCNGTCLVTIKDDLFMQPGSLLSAISGNPRDLLIYAESKDHRIWAISFPSVRIGSYSGLNASLYAPYGSVSIGRHVMVRGTLIGKDVTLGPRSIVADDPLGVAPDFGDFDRLSLPVSRVTIVTESEMEIDLLTGPATIEIKPGFMENLAEQLDFPSISLPEQELKAIRFYTLDNVTVTEGEETYPVRMVTSGNREFFEAQGQFGIQSGQITEIRISAGGEFSLFRAFDKEYILRPDFRLEMLRLFDETLRSLVDRYAGEYAHAIIAESDIIARVSVDGLASQYETIGRHSVITTDVTVNISELFLDNSGEATIGDRFIIKTLGGEVDGIRMFPSHVASFAPGESALVFVRKIDGRNYITFGNIGKINH